MDDELKHVFISKDRVYRCIIHDRWFTFEAVRDIWFREDPNITDIDAASRLCDIEGS